MGTYMVIRTRHTRYTRVSAADSSPPSAANRRITRRQTHTARCRARIHSFRPPGFILSSGDEVTSHVIAPAKRGASSLLEIAGRNLWRNCDGDFYTRGSGDAPTCGALNLIDERNLLALSNYSRAITRARYMPARK